MNPIRWFAEFVLMLAMILAARRCIAKEEKEGEEE
jgi:hypothetical protein